MSESLANMSNTKNHIDNQTARGMEDLRNNSTGRLDTENITDSHVLVLYTGGTIGMIRNEDGG